MKRAILAVAVCVLLPAAAFSDIVVTYDFADATDGSGLTTPVAGAVVDTFTDPRPGWTYDGNGAIYNTSQQGVRAQPAGNTTDYFCIPEAGGTIPATVAVSGFGLPADYLGLYWGSIDTYNNISFFLDGDQVGDTFSGADVPVTPPAEYGDWYAAETNRYVNFFFTDGQMFDEVRFGTTGVAFEFDNLAIRPVPVPGAALLGFLGLGAAGMKLRRRMG